MSDPAHVSAAAHGGSAERVSIPYVILVSVLCGVGLLGTAYWLITFQWLYFLSLGALIAGAYLLFTRLTGPDHA